MSKRICANSVAIVTMIKNLDGGATVPELVRETGLHEVTVRRWVHHFRMADLVHVSGHEPSTGGRQLRVWSWGKGRDVVFKRETSTQRWHRHMARKRDRMMREALHA